jgi:hypothetical protein
MEGNLTMEHFRTAKRLKNVDKGIQIWRAYMIDRAFFCFPSGIHLDVHVLQKQTHFDRINGTDIAFRSHIFLTNLINSRLTDNSQEVY